jgi:hypothetical protein
VREVVKQRDNFGVPLPQELVDSLQWHVETQLDERQIENDEQRCGSGTRRIERVNAERGSLP